MRRSLLGLTAVATALLFAACEGPAGPQGPPGQDGVDGVDGVNAAETCSDCHNDDTELLAKQLQYEASKHANGLTFARGESSDCAPCHSHEGFVDALVTGAQTSDAAAAEQTPVNCRTCHTVHETFTNADFALRTEAPVSLWLNDVSGEDITVDYGNGNVCANCHQPRPRYLDDILAGGSVTISSSRFGPHHGPVASLLWGTGGYEYDGETYTSSSHKNAEDGCVTCHMATPYGADAGGHTLDMYYDDHGHETAWVVGCGAAGCHDVSDEDLEDALRSDMADEQGLIWSDVDEDGVLDWDGTDTGLLPDLKALLVQIQLLDPETELNETGGVWPADVAGALWNYQTVREDRSKGLHNFNYATDLLETSIAAVEAYIAAVEAVETDFSNSLHATKVGKATWWNDADGFGPQTGLNYDDLSCKNCHNAARRPDWTQADCQDCHDNPTGGGAVAESTCLGCHGRQAAERNHYNTDNTANSFTTDVHVAAGLTCMDCHNSAEVHGNGTAYSSLLEAGAMTTSCDQAGCHASVPSNSFHDVGAHTNVDCSTCHMQGVVTCYNCHFEAETDLDPGQKIAYGQFTGWMFLLNYEGKVHPGNFQSVKYGTESFLAMAPFYAHTISKNAVTACSDCHDNMGGDNALIDELNANSTIDVVSWDAGTSKLTHAMGRIPIPPDWETVLLFDFVNLTNMSAAPAERVWEFMEAGPDNFQMLFGTPLTAGQMNSLGATGY